MIETQLKQGSRAVYIGIYRPYVGTVVKVERVTYGWPFPPEILVTLRMDDGSSDRFPLGRHLVPKAAYKGQGFGNWEVMPYRWTDIPNNI